MRLLTIKVNLDTSVDLQHASIKFFFSDFHGSFILTAEDGMTHNSESTRYVKRGNNESLITEPSGSDNMKNKV